MTRHYFSFLSLLLYFISPLTYAHAASIETGISGAPAITVLPAPPQSDSAEVELGKKLFFDPILSGNNAISCASCHNPEKGWGDGIPRAIGASGKELGRNTPHLFNTGIQIRWFWDGRASSLEEQALGPIEGTGEMHQNLNALVVELRDSGVYRRMFAHVFGEKGISIATITQSLAAFERTIISKGSPFEQYLRGDQQAMSMQAKHGLALFTGKARCILCHNGANLTDNGFHNIGIVPEGSAENDTGHYKTLAIESQYGAFKTPSLHSTAKTAPYMHNGSIETLKQVILFYNRGGDIEEHRDPQIKPLNLSASERRDLLAFLNALTGTIEP